MVSYDTDDEPSPGSETLLFPSMRCCPFARAPKGRGSNPGGAAASYIACLFQFRDPDDLAVAFHE